MLNISVYTSLSQLISQLHGLVGQVREQASVAEVELRIAAVSRTLTAVQETIGASPTHAFGSFSQHLSWVKHWYRKNKPNDYESNLNDLQGQDLVWVAQAVDSWAQTLLDPRLRDAIQKSWSARRYTSAVRDSFVCLEGTLRTAGQIDPSRGLPGGKLVSEVFSSGNPYMTSFPSDGFIGNLNAGQKEGLQHLVRGAFLLFRNATSHRDISYSASEAENIIQLVNLCLRFFPQIAE